MLTNAKAKAASKAFLTDIQNNEQYSYETLYDLTQSIRHLLSDYKVVKGDRVAFVTRNEAMFYPLFFACSAVGAVLVPISPENHPSEIKSMLMDAKPKLTFYGEGMEDLSILGKQRIALKKSNLPAITGEETLKCLPLSDEECYKDDDALIIYTSGTTGNCKGIVLSQNNLYSMANAFATMYKYQENQRFLCILPFYHINAIMVTGLACVLSRAHIVLSSLFGPLVGKFFWKIVSDNKIDVLSLTPSIMAMLLKLFPSGADHDISHVSHALVGTAPLSKTLWKHFEDIFGIPCYQGYGLTETTTWATMTPMKEPRHFESVGLPISCCEIKIMEYDSVGEVAYTQHQEMDNRDKKVGEILIRGDIVMKGYYNRKMFTKKNFFKGWFKTGDIGYFGKDGHLYIVGRIKNIIKRKGITLFPEEVNDALREHENIVDCCAFGVEDELLGEKVILACLVKDKEQEDVSEFRSYLRSRLSSHKLPDQYVIMREFPRTSMGKININELKSIVGGKRASEVIKLLNIPKFRRANCENDSEINRLVQKSILSGEKLGMIAYWGGGKRSKLNKFDIGALDNIEMIKVSINELMGRKSIDFTLILTDIHVKVNRVPTEIMEAYFAAIQSEAESREIKTIQLSHIWEKSGLDFDAVVNSVNQPGFTEKWKRFGHQELFILQAEKRCSTSELAMVLAKQYFAIVEAENTVIARLFADHIFFTYNDLSYKKFLPKLPTVHWYSHVDGNTKKSDKPWFTN